MTSSDTTTINLGKNIILAGLAIQCITLFLFLFVAVNVHLRPQYLLRGKPDGSKLSWGLYITTALMFLRSIYRAAEYSSGRDGYLSTHEWPMYAFDTLPIMLAIVCYQIPALHFGRCLNALREQQDAMFDAAAVDVSSASVSSLKNDNDVQMVKPGCAPFAVEDRRIQPHPMAGFAGHGSSMV